MEDTEPQNGSKLLLFGFLVLILIGINFFFGFEYSKKTGSQPRSWSEAQSAYILPLSEPNYLPILDSDISIPTIKAKSALVYDLRSGRSLYEKDSSLKLPIASLTKIMTAVIVLEHYNLQDIVLVKNTACPIVGRVSMNITSFEVSHIPDIEVGERVIVISADDTSPNSVEKIARTCETIPYEILVHVPAHLRRVVV